VLNDHYLLNKSVYFSYKLKVNFASFQSGKNVIAVTIEINTDYHFILMTDRHMFQR